MITARPVSWEDAIQVERLIWPASFGFTHVTERETEVANGLTRYVLSDALESAFLPLRQALLEQYLDRTLVVACSRRCGRSADCLCTDA